jgi:hypothetical protein
MTAIKTRVSVALGSESALIACAKFNITTELLTMPFNMLAYGHLIEH